MKTINWTKTVLLTGAVVGALAVGPLTAEAQGRGGGGSHGSGRGGAPRASAPAHFSARGHWNGHGGHWRGSGRGGWGHRRYWPGYYSYYGFGYPYYYGYPWGYPYYGVSANFYSNGNGRVYDGSAVPMAVAVQQNLARAGYYRGPIDGIIGSGTRRAIRAYERAHGLPVDGLIDQDLLAKMGLS